MKRIGDQAGITAWHEAGHAIWALANKLNPEIKHGPHENNPNAFATCILPDGEGPEVGTIKHIEWKLSGLAAEKVYCDLNDFVFSLYEVEWDEGVMDAWLLLDSKSFEAFESQLGSKTYQDYVQNAPSEALEATLSVFTALHELAKNEPRLEKIAVEALQGDVSQATLSKLWS